MQAINPVSANPTPLPPFLKWAGSKRQHTSLVQDLYETHRNKRWVEPFLGSGALPLALAPEQVLASDINPHLIDLWQWVQRDGICKLTMPPGEEYYKVRDEFNVLSRLNFEDEEEEEDINIKCELLLYLNRHCYNGLYRTNLKGGFNTPRGKFKSVKIPRDLSAYREAIAHWEIACASYDTILVRVDKDDFVFLDPPYWSGGKTEFTAYFGRFDWQEQVKLAEFAAILPCPVILCNADCPQIEELYEKLGFKLIRHKVRRSISCKGDRSLATEIVALKNF